MFLAAALVALVGPFGPCCPGSNPWSIRAVRSVRSVSDFQFAVGFDIFIIFYFVTFDRSKVPGITFFE